MKDPGQHVWSVLKVLPKLFTFFFWIRGSQCLSLHYISQRSPVSQTVWWRLLPFGFSVDAVWASVDGALLFSSVMLAVTVHKNNCVCVFVCVLVCVVNSNIYLVSLCVESLKCLMILNIWYLNIYCMILYIYNI